MEYWLGVSRKIWYAYDSVNVGTFYVQGTGNLTDAGTAYIQVASWLTGASLNGQFQLTNGAIWYGDLTRSGGYQARIIWTPADGATAYSVPAQFTQYRDYAGMKHNISNHTVTLGIIPILLESGDPP